MMQSEDKLCVVVLFGGMSSEHEVSRVSAGTFVDNLDRSRYEVLTVGITKEGRWLYTEASSAQMADGSWEELPGNMPCVLSPDRADHGMILFTPAGQVEKLHVDVVIPALHGLWGEDGTVQGLLELAGIPYVGCGVLASAVCMDKAVANALFDAAGIPHTKWLAANRWEIESDLEGVCDGAIAKLGWPIFVKPANAGSSVGITKAHDRAELKDAIALALENDRKVVFEAFTRSSAPSSVPTPLWPPAPVRSSPVPSSTPTTISTRTASVRWSSRPNSTKPSSTRSRPTPPWPTRP